LYHAIKEYDLEPIREDFRNVSGEVKKQFVQELEEMDQGHVGFFDMNMTRSLSVLPEDIPDLAHQITGVLENQQQPPKLVQYAALFFAVCRFQQKYRISHARSRFGATQTILENGSYFGWLISIRRLSISETRHSNVVPGPVAHLFGGDCYV
jgi:hypothetical protein